MTKHSGSRLGREAMLRDGLRRNALDALASLFSARRRLLAFTGSGLSLIYGGLTWNEAVLAIVEDTLCLLEEATQSARDPKGRDIFQRYTDMLKVYAPEFYDKIESRRPYLSSADRMVVLELCEEARTHLRRSNDKVDGANAYFANLVYNDQNAVDLRLADRLSGYASTRGAPSKRRAARTEQLATIRPSGKSEKDAAAIFYSQKTFEFIASYGGPRADCVNKVLETLRGELKYAGCEEYSAFPIDRRSSFAPFMGLLSPEERSQMAKAVLEGVDSSKTSSLPARPLTDPLKKLADELMIRRFMTINYDWELERLLLYPDKMVETKRAFDPKDGVKDGILEQSPNVPGGALTRRMPDGRYVASEVYAVHSSARLFDFALNSEDHSAYILHLHGRADNPEGMVAREPDYHRTYRRDTGNPRALERALDVSLTGNPILIVGLGLTEAELTRAFKQLVANGRVTPDRPAFVLLPSDNDNQTYAWREKAAYYQQFGIHVLHYGESGLRKDQSLAVHREYLESLRSRAVKYRDRERFKRDRKIETFEYLGILQEMPTDFVIVSFIARILARGTTGVDREMALLGCDCSSGDRRATAMLGFEDYITRLISRIKTHALSAEISRLADFISQTVTTADDFPEVREKAMWRREPDTGPELYTRHMKVKVEAAETTARAVLDNASAVSGLLDIRRSSFAVGAPHSGKGSIARHLIAKRICPTLVVNFTFAVEVDGSIALIFQFLKEQNLIPEDAQLNRLTYIADAIGKNASQAHPKCRIILAGLERLIDKKGRCLSPDMDTLLQAIMFAPEFPEVTVVLMGTETLLLWRECEISRVTRQASPQIVRITGGVDTGGVAKAFHDAIGQTKATPMETRAIGLRTEVARRQGSPAERTHHMVETIIAYWGAWIRSSLEGDDNEERIIALDMAVLRFLSIVTAPVEREILRHVPEIESALADLIRPTGAVNSAENYDNLLGESLKRLVSAHLAVELDEVKDDAAKDEQEKIIRKARYALHRVVLEVMRGRLGVPIGDSVLSNTFTLTLAASLPVDHAIPDNDIREEMERTLAHLRGAWKDSSVISQGDVAGALKLLRGALIPAGAVPQEDQYKARYELWRRLEKLVATSDVAIGPALRASCNLIRSFFTATALVMLTSEDVDTSTQGLTPFELHKRRIRKLLSRTRQLHLLSARPSAEPDRLSDPGNSGPNAAPESDYRSPDTISGLLKRIEENVEKRDRQVEVAIKMLKHCEGKHRRSKPPAPLYGGEIVWLHNERAVISLIQGDLYEAGYSFERALGANTHYKGDGRGNNRNRIDLNRSLLLIERGKITEARVLLHCVAGDVQQRVASEREKILPLVEGYLGLVAHLNGRSNDALHHYEIAINGLISTEQLRALSLFQMRRAALLGAMHRNKDALTDIGESIRSAEACRQIDLLWRARLLRSSLDIETSDRDHISQQAFIAAERLGLVRVAVEALMGRAESALRTRNYNFAADLVSQAMARASRSGMTLRRVALRVVMGRIMLGQGDENGAWLIRRAIALADRIGYQSCVQNANETLLRHRRGYAGDS